ncbi:MAG: hypothetical protein AAF974_04035 [Cyanobacteria bacterium P01_E01_bin.34]
MITIASAARQLPENLALLFSQRTISVESTLPIQRQEKEGGWVDYYVGDVMSRPDSDRRSIRLPSHKLAFHYLSLHRTLIQRMGKPSGLSDDLWQNICEMIRRRQ